MFVGVIHATRFNKKYHFSWLAVGKNSKWDWEGARNYCRKFCMDSITIESKQEKDWVKNLIRKENLHYTWTGGRKCNFKGNAAPHNKRTVSASDVKRSIGSTTGFHNHGEGPSRGLLRDCAT